jgi:hypothetical protein
MATPAAALRNRKDSFTYVEGFDYIDRDCLALWAQARSIPARRSDTWVGLTDLETQRFYLYPTFGVIPAPNQALGEPVANPGAATEIRRERLFDKNFDIVPKSELDIAYGDNALYVNLTGTQQGAALLYSFDGNAHRAVLRKLAARGVFGPNVDLAAQERQMLGWAIRPVTTQADGSFMIRYSSGRNENKFASRGPMLKRQEDLTPEEDLDSILSGRPLEDDPARSAARDRAKREKRDLPKAWASWIREVICKKLIVAVEEQLGSERLGRPTICVLNNADTRHESRDGKTARVTVVTTRILGRM